ncbi:hypothetical protein [Hymenobacter sp.]|jgi:hypothetical protein|uniref:hypothetical protein n=1 Tax=Hymenobacter sp. TaxID=1898978 RepID=UPI002EDB7CDD
MKKLLFFLLLLSVAGNTQAQKTKIKTKGAVNAPASQVWSTDKAWAWYRAHPWMSGANFTPSTAINQLEMWQADTFDPTTIDRELGWAEGIGFNTMRVFLHSQALAARPQRL